MEQGPSQRLGRVGSGIDDQVRRAYAGVAPTAYFPKKPEMSGGRISEAKLPSAIDHGAHLKSFVPGPGSYQTPEMGDYALPEGGRLNRIPPQEKFKLDECPIPPPGTYGVPNDPTVPRQLYGSFGKDPRVTKFIEEEIMRSRDVPAPGEHEVLESMDNMRPFCPEGGRYMETGRGTGYFDSAAKMAEGKPGPDRYNLPGALRSNKTAGKLVWKYKSDTLEDTKKIITKVVGNAHDNPAPGHYSLPDPAPIAPVPTMKGRDTCPAMPHPFAYNCAPDHGQKFLMPVREQNSGDQIYGRDLKRNTVGREDRATRARASADEVAAGNLPSHMGQQRDGGIEQPGETTSWKAGGFAKLGRARSAPGMARSRLHPVVEETMVHYPALSRFHGRRDKTFAPMAVKRPETVNCGRRSDSYKSLQKKKWEMKAILGALEGTTAAAMEPLNEQLLRDEAATGLMDKAKFRMRMEGLSMDQQDLVLGEFFGVVDETISLAPSVSAMASVLDPLAEPFSEPLPREKPAATRRAQFQPPWVPDPEPFAEP